MTGDCATLPGVNVEHLQVFGGMRVESFEPGVSAWLPGLVAE